MSNAQVAERRLRGVRLLPEAIEKSFRAALRETIFIPQSSARFARDLDARAKYHLTVHLGSRADTVDRQRAANGLTFVIERFLKTRLCDRLRRLPVDRIYAPITSTCDLLVIGPDLKRYALSFVIMPRLLAQKPANERQANPADFDESLVCDLATSRIIRLCGSRPANLLCA